MQLWRKQALPEIETERLTLRLPQHRDFHQWLSLRAKGQAFLTPWEPSWAADHLTRRAFTNRVFWAHKSLEQQTALVLYLIRRADNRMIGALTVSEIRHGAANTGTLGYWMGESFTRQGFMAEALDAAVDYCFTEFGLSRLEAACLPENDASRGLLKRCGFGYEGKSTAYLQINGAWRTHLRYALLRADRAEAST